MAFDHSVIGVPGEPTKRSWSSSDALLYALGVGAGLDDPLQELQFTTENSEGVPQRVLPTYAALLAQQGPRHIGEYNRAMRVHAEEEFELHGVLPVDGTVETVATVVGIYDKGSGALVVAENTAVDVATGEVLITSRSSSFIRGEGGFGGDRGPENGWQRPDREPDHRVVMKTRPEQPLIYRLTGDRNPLHSDPVFAARGGFERPIMHGMCTYGFTGRALIGTVCGSDPARFRSMSGRFTRPVLSGETLVVSIWSEDDNTALFQTSTTDGTVVIDRGRVGLR